MLPKKNRISRKDFPTNKDRGLRVSHVLFTAVFYKLDSSGAKESKASIVVSKKTAKTAVERNNLRRRFYALGELFLKDAQSPITVVVYPKAESQKIKFLTLRHEIEMALKQTHVR